MLVKLCEKRLNAAYPTAPKVQGLNEVTYPNSGNFTQNKNTNINETSHSFRIMIGILEIFDIPNNI